MTFGITGDEGGDHISSIGYGRPRQRFVDYREAGKGVQAYDGMSISGEVTDRTEYTRGAHD